MNAQPAADLCKVLIVDDEPGVISALRRTLLEEHIVLTAPSGADALDLLSRNPDVAAIISDQRMPGMTGAEFLSKAREIATDAQRIVLTGYTDLEDVVRMINEGKIHFYLNKPWESADLKLALRRACETWQLQRENRRLLAELQDAHARLQKENVELRTQVAGRFGFEGIIGTSKAMRDTLDLLKKVLTTDTSVLILGETGSGKEVLARALHYAGPRAKRAFIAQNCAALPETLLASELFGHVKGAFTGAIREKKGLFEQADGGTIFLDEIGEVSPGFQQQLLRVLQEGEIWPVGSEKRTHVDVRVVAATNRKLEEDVRRGKFREDLYFRLNVFPIHIPPLRERREDIPLLADHFLQALGSRMNRSGATLAPDTLEKMLAYSWPGNVRELENEIERALVLAGEKGVIGLEALSPRIREASPSEMAAVVPLPRSTGEDGPRSVYSVLGDTSSSENGELRPLKETVEELEREILRQTLARHQGNKAQTARSLGLSRMGLDKKLARYGIESGRGKG